MTWAVLGAALLLVLMVCRRRVGVSDRDAAGPVARALRPVLAGAGCGVGPAGGGGSRAAGADAYGAGERCRRLTALADAAELAPRAARETAENELSAELAMVDTAVLGPALIAELADAEARVLLARRFHNDAVRDTWRCGCGGPCDGCASAEQRRCQRISRSPSARRCPRATRGSSPCARRRASCCSTSRVVLLFCGSDPRVRTSAAPKWWFTVGGQARPGETQQAAAREVFEETDCAPTPRTWSGRCGTRRDPGLQQRGGARHELFFVHRTRRFDPSTTGHTALERRYIHGSPLV